MQSLSLEPFQILRPYTAPRMELLHYADTPEPFAWTLKSPWLRPSIHLSWQYKASRSILTLHMEPRKRMHGVKVLKAM